MTFTPYEGAGFGNEKFDLEALEAQSDVLDEQLKLLEGSNQTAGPPQTTVEDPVTSTPSSITPAETQTTDTSERIPGIATTDFIKTQMQERALWANLPHGPERDAAKKAWNLKYYGEENPNILDRYGSNLRRRPFMDQSFGGKVPDISAIFGPAAALGLVDTGTDFINLIPGVNIPKLGKFESESLQATRNFAGLILPMLLLKRTTVAGGTALHKSKLAPAAIQKLGNDPIFKYFALFGAEVGTGALVDSVAEQNLYNDNFTGTLKATWPNTYRFIPNSIATGSSDSAEQKKNKNVREGAFLNIIAGFIESLVRLGKHGKSLDDATRNFIPENELAKSMQVEDEFSKKIFSENPLEDELLRYTARNEKALDELGEFYLRQDPNTLEPKLGAHDVFDVNESTIRPKDPDGVIGASVDAVQVTDNIESVYGRLASVITEAERQGGLTFEGLSNRAIVKKLAKELKAKFSAKLPSGHHISSKRINEVGVRLAEIINDPRMNPGDMKVLLDEFSTISDRGFRKLTDLGEKGVAKSIVKLKEEFFNMDIEKARAYFITSEAGQISDIAEGARLMRENPAVVSRAQDQILDRLKYLMVEKKLASYQTKMRRAHLNSFKEAIESGDPKIISETVSSIENVTNGQLANIIPEITDYIDVLRGVKDEYPDFLNSFMQILELTDGKVDSMFKMNEYVRNKLSIFKKSIIDTKPDMASLLVRTKIGQFYNSALSSLKTAQKALIGNTTGHIGKPVSVFSGAILEGDLSTLRRSFHKYVALKEALRNGWEHRKVVFKKVATNPTQVSYVVREDIAVKEIKDWEFLESYAAAAATRGEHGPEAILSIIEQNRGLELHPAFRFVPNQMSALDGFSRAMYGTAEARARGYDWLLKNGMEINDESLTAASSKIYKEFFDENGMISDSAVDYVTREASLNLDSPFVKNLNTALEHAPILKSIIMFARTKMNNLELMSKWNITDTFLGDWKAFKAYKTFEEYPKPKLKEVFASKGMPWESDAAARILFKEKVAEITGRVFIGTTIMTQVGLYAMDGNIRGNGHWDKEVQRARGPNWQRKTARNPLDGKWYSYEWLGPIGDLIASSVDLVDNFDSLSTGTFEGMMQKLSFIVGAGIIDNSVFSELEQVSDLLYMETPVQNKYITNFANNWMPGAGIRRDLSNIIAPYKREYDQDVFQLIRSRNSWLDILDRDNALPAKYNYITGEKIGHPENMWVRVNNAINDIKRHDEMTPAEEFIMEIEYDSKPFFNVSQGGIRYNNKQRADLYSMVGEQGIFRDEVLKIMKSAERMYWVHPETNERYDGMVNIVKALRRMGISTEDFDHKEYQLIFSRLDAALSDAKKAAEVVLRGTGNFIDLDSQEVELHLKKQKTRKGDIDYLFENTKSR